MDAAAELGRNSVSKYQFQPEYGDEQGDAGRDGRTGKYQFSLCFWHVGVLGHLDTRDCHLVEGVWYIHDWDTRSSILISSGSPTCSARTSITLCCLLYLVYSLRYVNYSV